MPEVVYQVSASGDDVHVRESDSVFTPTATVLNFGSYSATFFGYGCALLFRNVMLIQGATVTAAKVRVYSLATRADTLVKSRLGAHDVDNATMPANLTALMTAWGERTTAQVAYDDPASWTTSTWYDSTDIASVISEVVGRAGWVPGNDILIFWDDFENRSSTAAQKLRQFSGYDNNATLAPKLSITAEADQFYSLTFGQPSLNSASAGQYGQVTLAVTNGTGDTPTNVLLYRSATEGGTYTQVTAAVTNNGDGTWTLIHPRPALGTNWYKVATTDGITTSAQSTAVSATAALDTNATITARLGMLHTYMDSLTGDVVPTSSGEGYNMYWLGAMAYAYWRTGTAAYLTDCENQWAHLQTYLDTDGIWNNPEYFATNNQRALDIHGRYMWWSYMASRILRRAGATTLADTILTGVDAAATALLANFPLQTQPVNGNSVNQPVWQANHAYVYGDVVRQWVDEGTPDANATFVCETAGTSAATPGDDPWPFAAIGATVTDGATLVWRREAETFNYLPVAIQPTTPVAKFSNYDSPNQHLWPTACLVHLVHDPSSAHYGSSAATTAYTGSISAAFRYQLHSAADSAAPGSGTKSGFIPWGDAYLTTESSSYHMASLTSLVLAQHALGTSWSARLNDVISRAKTYASNWDTEPALGYELTVVAVNANDVGWRNFVRRYYDDTDPLEDLLWTTAFTGYTDGEQATYTQAGAASGTTNHLSERIFDGLLFEQALAAAPMEPGTPVLTLEANGDITVTFTDNATNEDGIEWRVDYGSGYGAETQIATPNTTSFTFTPTEGWTEVTVEVRSYAGSDPSGWVASNTLTSIQHYEGSATIACVSSVTASGVYGAKGAATIAAVSSTSASGVYGAHGSTTVACTSGMSASGILGAVGGAIVSAVSTVSASGRLGAFGSAVVACVSAVIAGSSETRSRLVRRMRGSSSILPKPTATQSGQRAEGGSMSVERKA